MLQVDGRKRWRIHPPVLTDPLERQPWGGRADEVVRHRRRAGRAGRRARTGRRALPAAWLAALRPGAGVPLAAPDRRRPRADPVRPGRGAAGAGRRGPPAARHAAVRHRRRRPRRHRAGADRDRRGAARLAAAGRPGRGRRPAAGPGLAGRPAGPDPTARPGRRTRRASTADSRIARPRRAALAARRDGRRPGGAAADRPHASPCPPSARRHCVPCSAPPVCGSATCPAWTTTPTGWCWPAGCCARRSPCRPEQPRRQCRRGAPRPESSPGERPARAGPGAPGRFSGSTTSSSTVVSSPVASTIASGRGPSSACRRSASRFAGASPASRPEQRHHQRQHRHPHRQVTAVPLADRPGAGPEGVRDDRPGRPAAGASSGFTDPGSSPAGRSGPAVRVRPAAAAPGRRSTCPGRRPADRRADGCPAGRAQLGHRSAHLGVDPLQHPPGRRRPPARRRARCSVGLGARPVRRRRTAGRARRCASARWARHPTGQLGAAGGRGRRRCSLATGSFIGTDHRG